MKTPRTRKNTLPTPPLPNRRQIAAGAIFLWIALSPWAWGYANNHAAVANHVSLVLAFAPLALIMTNLRPAAIITLLAGAWLTTSPWLLGYATDHAAWLNELVTGAALTTLCANTANNRPPKRARSRRAPEPAGAPTNIANTASSHP
jgi:SPW repeat